MGAGANRTDWRRPLTWFALTLALPGALAFMLVAWFHAEANNDLGRALMAWEDDFGEAHAGATQANDLARELEREVPVLFGDLTDGLASKLSRFIRLECRHGSTIARPVPPDVRRYLEQHADEVEAVTRLLVARGHPAWPSALLSPRQFVERADLRWRLRTLLLGDALRLLHDGRWTDAEARLQAAWNLLVTADRRPGCCFLAELGALEEVLVLVRRLPAPAGAWLDRTTALNLDRWTDDTLAVEAAILRRIATDDEAWREYQALQPHDSGLPGRLPGMLGRALRTRSAASSLEDVREARASWRDDTECHPEAYSWQRQRDWRMVDSLDVEEIRRFDALIVEVNLSQVAQVRVERDLTSRVLRLRAERTADGWPAEPPSWFDSSRCPEELVWTYELKEDGSLRVGYSFLPPSRQSPARTLVLPPQ